MNVLQALFDLAISEEIERRDNRWLYYFADTMRDAIRTQRTLGGKRVKISPKGRAILLFADDNGGEYNSGDVPNVGGAIDSAICRGLLERHRGGRYSLTNIGRYAAARLKSE